MPRIRSAEQALRLFAHASPQPYVCRTCRAQAVRQFHATRALSAEEPFFSRIRRSLFGSKESKEAERQREEKTKNKIEELANRGEENRGPEIQTDKSGRQFEVAEPVDPSINKDYVVASTWDGLEHMGSKEWVKARADQGEPYIGFVSPTRLQLSDEQWGKLLHHVTVEVLTLHKAGRDMNDICLSRSDNPDNWLRTRNTTIRLMEGRGDVSLSFKPPQAEQEIVQAILEPRQDEEVSNDALMLEEMAGAIAEGELPQYADESTWMNMRLQDPRIKLTITKRMMQLTGHRIPDPAISNAKTLADLYNAFKVKEKPKKLAQTEQLQRLKVEAPNVTVYSKRRTPIHKEKEVGRWKIIEDELKLRDLPVTGSRWQGAKTRLGA